MDSTRAHKSRDGTVTGRRVSRKWRRCLAARLKCNCARDCYASVRITEAIKDLSFRRVTGQTDRQTDRRIQYGKQHNAAGSRITRARRLATNTTQILFTPNRFFIYPDKLTAILCDKNSRNVNMRANGRRITQQKNKQTRSRKKEFTESLR